MKIQDILEVVIGLIIVGLILHFIKPYVPPQLEPLSTAVDVVFNALVAIAAIILDTLIKILELIKNLLPE